MVSASNSRTQPHCPPESRVDVRVSGSGTVYLFALLTEDARAWVTDYVSADADEDAEADEHEETL